MEYLKHLNSVPRRLHIVLLAHFCHVVQSYCKYVLYKSMSKLYHVVYAHSVYIHCRKTHSSLRKTHNARADEGPVTNHAPHLNMIIYTINCIINCIMLRN